MSFPYNAITAKDRVLFQTYACRPGLQVLAASYAGTNHGFHGYLGGINYVYFVATALGEITFNLKNIWSTFYGGLDPSNGNFDFNLATINNIQAQVVVPAPLNPPVGNVIFSVGGEGITLNYYVSGAIADFPANATIHFQIAFSRIGDSANGMEISP